MNRLQSGHYVGISVGNIVGDVVGDVVRYAWTFGCTFQMYTDVVLFCVQIYNKFLVEESHCFTD